MIPEIVNPLNPTPIVRNIRATTPLSIKNKQNRNTDSHPKPENKHFSHFKLLSLL